MNASAPADVLERPHQRVAAVFCIAALLSLWFARPLSWIPVGFVDMPHHLVLPVEALLALLAVPVILSARRRVSPILLIGITIFTLSLAFNWFRYRSDLVSGARLASFILVPWAAALTFQCQDRRRDLTRCLAALWLWQICLSLWCMAFSQEVIGSTGNRNWQAAFVLALTPWAWLWCSKRQNLKKKRIAYGVVLMASTLVLVACDSRAAWLALIAVAFLAVLFRLKWSWRIAALSVAILIPVFGFFSNPLWLAGKIKEDIRLPVTARTLAMMAENDGSTKILASLTGKGGAANELVAELRAPGPYGTLGIGPGNYRKAFAPYRATSTYSERTVAAATTEHPHNEWLNIAAQIGLLAAISWILVTILPIFRSIKPGAKIIEDAIPPLIPALSACSLLTCGLLDMPLVECPTSALFLIVAGLTWQNQLTPGAKSNKGWDRPRLAITGLSLMAALMLGGNLAVRELRISQCARQAFIKENFREDPEGARDLYLQAAGLSPNPSRYLLYAGSLAGKRLNDPEAALKYLIPVAQDDPNFGHLNQEIARALMLTGKHVDALPYLARERRLYPNKVGAWYRLYTGLFFCGQFEEAHHLTNQLPLQWRKSAHILRGGEANLIQLQKTWLSATSAKDADAATKAAESLLQRMDRSTADPLVFMLAGDNAIHIADRAKASFDAADLRYWQEELAINALIPASATTPQAILRAVKENVVVSDYDHPTVDLMNLKPGDAVTSDMAARLLTRAARQHGIPAFSTAWENKPAALLLTAPNKGIVIIPSDAWEEIAAPAKHPAKIDFPIQAYFSRNQMLLSIMMDGAAPPIPSSELIRLFAWLNEAPEGSRLEDYCEIPADML